MVVYRHYGGVNMAVRGVAITDVTKILQKDDITGNEKIPAMLSDSTEPQVVTTDTLRNYIADNIPTGGDKNIIENITLNGDSIIPRDKTVDLMESDPTVPSHVKNITQEDISAWNTKQDNIPDLSTIRQGAFAGYTAYQKPSTGVPLSDLSSEVREAIENAGSLTEEIDPVFSASPAGTITSQDISDWNNKANTSDIPTKTSELTNDSGFLTAHQDISGKADKSDTYTKQQVDSLIASVDVSDQLADYYTKTEIDNKGYLVQHQDISGKADKSEMSVTTISDRTTITLKDGLSASVINQHQDISNKQNVIDDLAAIRSGAAAGSTALQAMGTLGELSNVTDVVSTEEGLILYREAESTEWHTLSVAELAVLLEPISRVVRVNDAMGNTTQTFYTTASNALLMMSTVSRQKDNQIAGSTWENVTENMTLSIEKRVNSMWQLQATQTVTSNNTLTLDVMPYLNKEMNVLRFRVEGQTSGETSPYLVYNILLDVVYPHIYNLLDWTQPMTGSTMTVPLRYNGAMKKWLHMELYAANNLNTALQSKTVYLDTQEAIGSAVNYSFDNVPETDGLYVIKTWITTVDAEISSDVLSMQVLWHGNNSVGKWLIANSVVDRLVNWTTNNIMQYVLYDTTSTISSVTFTVEHNDAVIYEAALDSVNREVHTLSVVLEEDVADANFNVSISATDDIGGLTAVYGEWNLPVDNTVNYAVTQGATFIMNPATRSNSDANRTSIINTVDGSLVSVEWEGMAWASSDGWSTDYQGRKCLRLNAGQHGVINLHPFQENVAQGNGVTFEMNYMVDNISDLDTLVMDCSREVTVAGETYHVGLRVEAERVMSATEVAHNEITQELLLDSGTPIHLGFTVCPRAYTYEHNNTTYYLNLVRTYVNGRINRVYAFGNTDVMNTPAGISIGSDDCVTFIYGMKTYDRWLTPEEMHRNYINWLPTIAEKRIERESNDIFDTAHKIDFTKVRLQNKNVFVTDTPFPSLIEDTEYHLGGPKDTKKVNLELYILTALNTYINANPVRQRGQGTSSMRYWEWNQRLGTLDGTYVTYSDGQPVKTKKIRIWANVPDVSDLTMKKNWASSMQDHKAGSVNTLTDLWKLLEFSNEASDLDSKVRISVYQEPMIGFYKETVEGQTKYYCMGNFTGGPHKGDKGCFGYNLSTFPNTLSMEGCNNDPVLTQFKMPWDWSRVRVNTEDDILVEYRTGYDENHVGQWTKAWEQDFGGIESGDSSAVANPKLQSFINAYNVFYKNNQYIEPWEGTGAQLQAACEQWLTDFRNNVITAAEFNSRISKEYWLTTAGDGFSQYDLMTYDPSIQNFILAINDDGSKQNVEQEIV